MNTNSNNNIILNTENANSIITNNISSSSFFSDFDKDFFSVLDEVSRLDRIQRETNVRDIPEESVSFHYSDNTEDTSLISELILSPQESITSENIENLYPRIFQPNDNLYSIFERLNYINEDDYTDSLYETPSFKLVISEKGKSQLSSVKFTEDCKNNTCPITFQDFKIGDDVTQLPCLHCFQKKQLKLG